MWFKQKRFVIPIGILSLLSAMVISGSSSSSPSSTPVPVKAIDEVVVTKVPTVKPTVLPTTEPTAIVTPSLITPTVKPTSTPTVKPTLKPTKVPTIQTIRVIPTTTNSSYSCGSKKYCTQMASCSEAKYYYSNCGLKKLDGDDDGVPCEKLCN